MIIPCDEAIALNAYLASMRWNLSCGYFSSDQVLTERD